jgi:hypothetical protein
VQGSSFSSPALNEFLCYWLPFLLRFNRNLMSRHIAEVSDRTKRIKKENGAKKSRKSWIATFFK